MITLYLSGGLGNQMFQYAAGLTLARQHGVDLKIDLSEFAQYGLRHYMLDKFALSGDVRVVPGASSKLLFRLQRVLPDPKRYVEPHYHFDQAFFDLGENARIRGYFQSEKYFARIAGDIRKNFQLSEPLSHNAGVFHDAIKKAPVAVSLHVRRGDYVSDARTQKIHGCASPAYYRQAVEMMQGRWGADTIFFIFSDDPDYAGRAFDFCTNKHIVQGNDDRPHEDMFLMSRCDHHILANSSFSWWGAWLKEDSNKTVIAPRLWFSEEKLRTTSTRDLFPAGWEVI